MYVTRAYWTHPGWFLLIQNNLFDLSQCAKNYYFLWCQIGKSMVLEALSFEELMVPTHPLAFSVYIINNKTNTKPENKHKESPVKVLHFSPSPLPVPCRNCFTVLCVYLRYPFWCSCLSFQCPTVGKSAFTLGAITGI